MAMCLSKQAAGHGNSFGLRRTSESLFRYFLACAIAAILSFSVCAVEPVTGHPRLWLRPSDVPRLRSWATPQNPVWVALNELADSWKVDMDGAPATADSPAQPSRVPAEDTGDWQPEYYATEKYAQLFAFMSLVHPDSGAREDFARRARSLLMHVMNQAVLGPAEGVPFRRPAFYTEDSNRARALGEAFPLTVDWIYPHLTTADKSVIREVFLRWSGEIIREGYHHPEPVGLLNDPRLLADRLQVRWSCNNYFTAFTRNLGLLGLALDSADDPGAGLKESLRNATGSWLYLLDEMMRTDCQGGMFAEGEEYSPASAGYLAQFLWALETAGENDPSRWGPQVRWENTAFWNDLIPACFNSVSPGRRINPAYDYLGPVHETASYGDQEEFFPRDRIGLLGPLGLHEQQAGRPDRWAATRWALEHLQPGGSENLGTRVRDSNSASQGIFYFLLFDPGASPAQDPRPQFPTTHFLPGIGRLLSRTSWETNASWFTFKLSWTGIDHLNGDGNQFEFYRRGEWLTKERAGYDLDAGSSDNHNTIAVLNDDPGRAPDDYRTIEWLRGSQFLYVAGEPSLRARSLQPDFAYLLGDSTELYNYPEAGVTNVAHVSRSIVWLKPDHIVVYDRVATRVADRFKRFWLNLPTNAVVNGQSVRMTTPAGQQLFIQSLLPSGAIPMVEVNPEQPIRGDVAKGEPMTHRMRVEAPGNPRETRFLHVLQGADPGVAPDRTLHIASIAGTAFSGAVVGSTAVLFPDQLESSPAVATSITTTYRVPNSVKIHLVTGLTPGARYGFTRTPVGAAEEEIVVRAGGDVIADSGGVLRIVKESAPVRSVLVFTGDLQFQLRINVAAGQVIQIESSPDLTRWENLGEARPNATGSLEFTDLQPRPSTMRFFRAVAR